MNKGSALSRTLYWDAIYELALELKTQYPDQDLEAVTLSDIYSWTIKLPEFADDSELANDDILAAIYQEWYEEINPL